MPKFEDKNHYQLLGVERDASTDEIKEAYREIARVFHPDSNFYDEIVEKDQSNEHLRLFQLITSAYDTLRDKTKRAEYDRTLPADAVGGKHADIVELWQSWDAPSTDELLRKKRPRQESTTWNRFGVLQSMVEENGQQEESSEHEFHFNKGAIRTREEQTDEAPKLRVNALAVFCVALLVATVGFAAVLVQNL